MYEDNYTMPVEPEYLQIIADARSIGAISSDFLPFMTYDLVQSGYPKPDHGIMVPRPVGGSAVNGDLLPGGGMWVLAEAAALELAAKKQEIELLKTEVNEKTNLMRAYIDEFHKTILQDSLSIKFYNAFKNIIEKWKC